MAFTEPWSTYRKISPCVDLMKQRTIASFSRQWMARPFDIVFALLWDFCSGKFCGFLFFLLSARGFKCRLLNVTSENLTPFIFEGIKNIVLDTKQEAVHVTAWTRGEYWFPSVLSAFTEKHIILKLCLKSKITLHSVHYKSLRRHFTWEFLRWLRPSEQLFHRNNSLQ